MTATVSVLDRTRAQLRPTMQAAVARMDPAGRLPAAYHLGWCDQDGDPVPAGGGKAIRPTLALLSSAAVGAADEVGLPGAVAVELIHNFSLLHDDVIDGDLERRHRRTVWAIWGVPTAILTGDALLALAHEVVLESGAPGAAEAGRLLATVTRELTRGQTQDVAFETRDDVTLDECLDMAAGKTGSLLAASAAIGAVLAGAPPGAVAALSAFGAQFGLAFQLVDDVLGIWGDPAVTGKSVHSDLRARKKTLPVTWALASARGADVREWLATPGDPDSDSVAAMAALLDAAGARDWALAEAADRVARAERALSTADLKPEPVAEMAWLARYCVERTA